ncbi:MAG: OsmC family protein [Fidelibacterota bacterium]|jgi:putative redox protein|tara:strand:- start:443 stop:850 length:408 start_codon:yes stop_codon:yes gene_type:complete
MNKTSSVEYLGELRTRLIHFESGDTLFTDAPKDNEGKGEAFAPTDLVATALASCMISIMGIKARKNEIDIVGTKAEILKVMKSSPRRISRIEIEITFPKSYNDKNKKMLERAAITCPVGKSLHNDIEQKITFKYK